MSDSEAQRLEEANLELRSQYHELAALSGSLAHEIKNPLSVIRMNVDLLAEDFAQPQSPEQRRALTKVQLVQEQCERLQKLLDDFMKFVRVRNLNLLAGSLNDEVGRALDYIAPRAQKQGIEIVRYLDADLPSIRMDAEMLHAALMNLVINAVQAMPEGGTLTVRTRVTRDRVALDLIDTGRGMDAHTATHMFDAFFTTKDGGTGLGLPTAQKIIDAHGGRIDVQSELGVGTRFTLDFPMPARIGGDRP